MFKSLDACIKKVELSLFFHFKSEGGKSLPISPSLTTPNILSVIACNKTSASEWPIREFVLGILIPPNVTKLLMLSFFKSNL